MTEQAANGTYGSGSLKSIQAEVYARLQEISRISANAEFNGIKLMAYTPTGPDVGITGSGINLQVGLYADENSIINLNVRCFSDASVSGLFGGLTGLSNILSTAKGTGVTANTDLNQKAGMEMFAAACTGLKLDSYVEASETATFVLQGDGGHKANEMLTFIDAAINEISERATKIGAAQNRVESAMTALDVQSQNITSSLSTLRDTDISSESSTYIQQQILQQASATLLSTANQLPSIALNLI